MHTFLHGGELALHGYSIDLSRNFRPAQGEFDYFMFFLLHGLPVAWHDWINTVTLQWHSLGEAGTSPQQ